MADALFELDQIQKALDGTVDLSKPRVSKKALVEAVKSVNQSLKDLWVQVNGCGMTIEAKDKEVQEIQAMRRSVTDCQQNSEQIVAKVERLTEQLTKLSQRQEIASKAKEESDSSVRGLSERINGMQKNISTIESSVFSVNEKIDRLTSIILALCDVQSIESLNMACLYIPASRIMAESEDRQNLAEVLPHLRKEFQVQQKRMDQCRQDVERIEHSLNSKADGGDLTRIDILSRDTHDKLEDILNSFTDLGVRLPSADSTRGTLSGPAQFFSRLATMAENSVILTDKVRDLEQKMSTKIDDQALTFKLTLKYEEILDHLEKAINAEERNQTKTRVQQFAQDIFLMQDEIKSFRLDLESLQDVSVSNRLQDQIDYIRATMDVKMNTEDILELLKNKSDKQEVMKKIRDLSSKISAQIARREASSAPVEEIDEETTVCLSCNRPVAASLIRKNRTQSRGSIQTARSPDQIRKLLSAPTGSDLPHFHSHGSIPPYLQPEEELMNSNYEVVTEFMSDSIDGVAARRPHTVAESPIFRSNQVQRSPTAPESSSRERGRQSDVILPQVRDSSSSHPRARDRSSSPPRSPSPVSLSSPGVSPYHMPSVTTVGRRQASLSSSASENIITGIKSSLHFHPLSESHEPESTMHRSSSAQNIKSHTNHTPESAGRTQSQKNTLNEITSWEEPHDDAEWTSSLPVIAVKPQHVTIESVFDIDKRASSSSGSRTHSSKGKREKTSMRAVPSSAGWNRPSRQSLRSSPSDLEDGGLSVSPAKLSHIPIVDQSLGSTNVEY